MINKAFGDFIARTWWAWIAVWVVLLGILWLVAPDWESVVQQGDFAFLPDDVESRRAARLLEESFPREDYGSSLLFVVEREDGPLTETDRRFISRRLLPLLGETEEDRAEAAAARAGEQADDERNEEEPTAEPPDAADVDAENLDGDAEPAADRDSAFEEVTPEDDAPSEEEPEERPAEEPAADVLAPSRGEVGTRGTTESESAAEGAGDTIVRRVLSYTDPVAGRLLVSDDERSTLILATLQTGYQHERTWEFVNELQKELTRLRESGRLPEGLDVGLAGSAVLGHDLITMRTRSAEWIQSWTVWIVVGLLFVVFRAPLISLTPLVTLYIAVQVAMKLLALMASAGIVGLFDGLEVYTTVIVYGAGIDYGLFLIARYREELAEQPDARAAMSESMDHTGSAILASAFTEIVGIGLLAFASFGKLQQAGVAISFGLFVMLLASLTLTPAVIRMLGHWAFWPARPERRASSEGSTWALWIWEQIGRRVVKRPGVVQLATLACLLPFALVGVWNYNSVSYGLFEELPRDAPSVRGTQMVQEHFPRGAVGPLTLLVKSPLGDIREGDEIERGESRQLTRALLDDKQRLHIDDLHSLIEPLGLEEEPEIESRTSALLNLIFGEVIRFEADQYYVSRMWEEDARIERVRILLNVDPFSREAIELIDEIERVAENAVEEDAEVLLAGPTSSLRSLKYVAERDRWFLQPLIAGAVLLVLIALLRRIVVPAYLIASVLLTFLVTIGVTWSLFRILGGPGFTGLDWTVPLLLFTLLVAIGADYNILLVNRSDEERAEHGLREGIVIAVRQTGAIITSCGVVMAGTFSTLIFGGELSSLVQLGFALVFGVLLDTVVVRPLLVPTFLVLLAQWRRDGDASEKREPEPVATAEP